MNDFTYRQYLERKISGEGQKRKGARTRDRLKIAASDLLNKISYKKMRVSDICDVAKVSPGTFYLYYKNKTEISKEVVGEFVELFYDTVETVNTTDTFQSIFSANRAAMSVARANPGLMRGLVQLGEDESDFAIQEFEINNSWTLRMAHSIAKNLDMENLAIAHFAANAMSAMMDQWISRIIVAEDTYIAALVSDLSLSDDDMCECLSVLWYRAIYGKNPHAVESEAAKQIVAMADKSI